jgi:hypothetical protein
MKSLLRAASLILQLSRCAPPSAAGSHFPRSNAVIQRLYPCIMASCSPFRTTAASGSRSVLPPFPPRLRLEKRTHANDVGFRFEWLPTALHFLCCKMDTPIWSQSRLRYITVSWYWFTPERNKLLLFTYSLIRTVESYCLPTSRLRRNHVLLPFEQKQTVTLLQSRFLSPLFLFLA